MKNLPLPHPLHHLHHQSLQELECLQVQLSHCHQKNLCSLVPLIHFHCCLSGEAVGGGGVGVDLDAFPLPFTFLGKFPLFAILAGPDVSCGACNKSLFLDLLPLPLADMICSFFFLK